jgi:hypothetical protein
LGDAVAVYFGRYPGTNHDKFANIYGADAAAMGTKVREVVTEATRVEVDWTGLSLGDGGAAFMSVIADRHPDFSADALQAIFNGYTYLMK